MKVCNNKHIFDSTSVLVSYWVVKKTSLYKLKLLLTNKNLALLNPQFFFSVNIIKHITASSSRYMLK